MFCDKCGTQFRDGAKFCPKCGNKIPSDSTEIFSAKSVSNKDDICDIGEGAQKITKKSVNKKILIPIVALALVVIITVLVVVNIFSTKKSTLRNTSFSIPAGYNLELEDSYSLLGANEKNEYANLIAVADNGVFAARTKDESIIVYANGTAKKIETYSEKALLSGDGSKLVYKGTDKKIYYYDVPSGNATAINNSDNKEYTPEGISYDGSTVCLSDGFGLSISKNGKEPTFLNAFSHLLAISDDGEYIYYYISSVSYSEGKNGERKDEEHHNNLEVWHKNSVQTIMKQSDPNNSYSIASINRKGNEIVFEFNKSSYYYSYEKAKFETITKDITDRIFSIECFRYDGDGLTYKEYNDSISQDGVLNSFYILIETNGYRIGYLNDKLHFQVLTETINEYGREFAFSSDRKKLWCTNNGKLTYHLAEDSNVTKKTVDIPVKTMDNNLHYISANDDCSEACFVGTDGYAYVVNPDTISNPQKIEIASSYIPTYDSDGKLYVLALENPQKISENFFELYSVDKTGQKKHEYSHVSKVAPTQNHLYIFVGGYNHSGYFDVLEKTDSGYTTVYSDTHYFHEVWN